MKKIYLLATLGIVTFLFLVACQPKVENPITGELVSDEPLVSTESSDESVPMSKEVSDVKSGSKPTDLFQLTEITCRGPDGFSPETYKARAGEKVLIKNENTKKAETVLTFQNDKTKQFVTSKLIRYGATGEVIFNEPGSYTFWSVGYAPKGKIVIE